MEEKQDYTMKEVVTLTGLTEHTIRKWLSEFNIQVDETAGGHRRFPRQAVESLLVAKRKKEDQGWSIKQIRNFFNGDLTTEMLEDPSIKSNLEKRMESMEEAMRMLVEANKNLAGKLDERERNFEITLKQALETQEENILDAVNHKLSDETEKRDRVLMLELRKTQEEIAAANKKKWYQFWK